MPPGSRGGSPTSTATSPACRHDSLTATRAKGGGRGLASRYSLVLLVVLLSLASTLLMIGSTDQVTAGCEAGDIGCVAGLSSPPPPAAALGMRRLFSLGGGRALFLGPSARGRTSGQLPAGESAAAVSSYGGEGGVDGRRVIVGMFSGRRRNLRMVLKYMQVLVTRGLVSELHLWDFQGRGGRVRDAEDLRVMKAMADQQWFEFYDHYARLAPTAYNGSVIIKADDDVIYWDVEAFEGFVRHRLQHPEYLMLFPGIVNNGVAAYYMQREGVLPPANSIIGPLPYDTLYGKLVEGGKLASRLHWHFLKHTDLHLKRARGLREPIIPHPLGHRASINCFAVLSEEAPRLFHWINQHCKVVGDDERCLTVDAPWVSRKPMAFDLSMTVVHLSFGTQRPRLDVSELYPWYESEAERVLRDEGLATTP